MEDRSVIQPILDALSYFNESEEELHYFYTIIDKFCANWFGNTIGSDHLNKVDYHLLHEMLGEYLRFEENNKRIALWLLAINRVCYNYTANLSMFIKEVRELEDTIENDLDNSLITPILENLTSLETEHVEAVKNNLGHNDQIGNFLQWVMVYTNYIYPTLDNKANYYDKKVLKAMNFLLVEFIKQRSNDKRMAFLLIAIMEACRQYAFHNQYVDASTISFPKDSETIVAGSEEALVKELLDRLRNETIKQRNEPKLRREILADSYIRNSFEAFLEKITSNPDECVATFNTYTAELASKLLSFDQGQQFLYLQTLYRYKSDIGDSIPAQIRQSLQRSTELLSEKVRNWFSTENTRMHKDKDLYIEDLLGSLHTKTTSSRLNAAKLYIMLYMLNKFDLL
jgi:hypothetical protein